jgi:RNA polymerase sigma-70 factor (ECF subfamily)
MTNEATAAEAGDPARVPDEALIRRMQAGDLDAFEALFLRYRAAIYRTAYGLTGDRHAAEEVLQDTFARAYQRRAILRTDMSPLPWLHRVAINLCYTRLGRRRLPAGPIEEAVLRLVRDGAAEPAERAERRELRQIVREGVAALPPKHQGVVLFYYLHGLSLQETATALDLPLGTVKSRIHYALRSLRAQLEADRRFGGAYGPAAEVIEAEP